MRIRTCLVLLLAAGCGRAAKPGGDGGPDAFKAAQPADIAAILPKSDDLRQFKTEGDPKLYTGAELKDFDPHKITLYTGFGFARVAVQTYIRNTDGTRFTAAVYDMVQPINAYGLYMSLTNEKASGLDFVQHGRLHLSKAEFQKGEFFVRVMAEPSSQNDISARGLAERVSVKVPQTRGEPVARRLGLLPAGYEVSTVRYHLRGAFAHKFLQDTLDAGYKVGRRKPGRLFYARMESEDAAVQAMASLDESYKKAKVRVRSLNPSSRLGELAFTADDVFYGRGIFFQSGPYVGGMFGAGTSADAMAKVQELKKNIQDAIRMEKRKRR